MYNIQILNRYCRPTGVYELTGSISFHKCSSDYQNQLLVTYVIMAISSATGETNESQ